MLYLVIGLVLCAVVAGVLAWRNHGLRVRLAKAEASRRELLRSRDAQRRNREALREQEEAAKASTTEIRQLRAALQDWQMDYQSLEDDWRNVKAALNEETGRRIAAEKESGLKNMKLERLERDLDESLQLLRARNGQARQTEENLQEIIQKQAEEIARLQETQQNPLQRRPRRFRAEQAEGQITVEEILHRGDRSQGKR